MSNNRGFVAVHAGAGYHSRTNSNAYLRVCEAACEVAAKKLRSSGCALSAAVAATVVLEDAGCTNAGVGSNLTAAETVECDASLMDSRSHLFGAVGALSNVKNPILVARQILHRQLNCAKGASRGFDIGLVSPCTLTGDGALRFARKETKRTENAVGTIFDNANDMITADSLKSFRSALSRLKRNEETDDLRCDTVGAVVVDSNGHVAVTSSSGGVLLKSPGRLGSAAIRGSGCWTEEEDSFAVGITASGCGEALIHTNFAQSIAKCILADHKPCCSSHQNGGSFDASEQHELTETLAKFADRNFFHSKFLQHLQEQNRLFGALCVCIDRSANSKAGERENVALACKGELVWLHNAESFALGYMNLGVDAKPLTRISRHSREDYSERNLAKPVICGIPIKL